MSVLSKYQIVGIAVNLNLNFTPSIGEPFIDVFRQLAKMQVIQRNERIGIETRRLLLEISNNGGNVMAMQKQDLSVMNREIAEFVFWSLDHYAKEFNIQIIEVDVKHLGITCSSCNAKGAAYHTDNRFKCGLCGFSEDADLNEAINIGRIAAKSIADDLISQAFNIVDRVYLLREPEMESVLEVKWYATQFANQISLKADKVQSETKNAINALFPSGIYEGKILSPDLHLIFDNKLRIFKHMQEVMSFDPITKKIELPDESMIFMKNRQEYSIRKNMYMIGILGELNRNLSRFIGKKRIRNALKDTKEE